ncbi:MAG TPA: hypothetical protein VHN14_30125 [Kofleriaceae bacterium]|jgi:hypothetical protein|nr:hypothetical protein [Kofleriaceae bacterium]
MTTWQLVVQYQGEKTAKVAKQFVKDVRNGNVLEVSIKAKQGDNDNRYLKVDDANENDPGDIVLTGPGKLQNTIAARGSTESDLSNAKGLHVYKLNGTLIGTVLEVNRYD